MSTLQKLQALAHVQFVDDERDGGSGVMITLKEGYGFADEPSCGVRGYDTPEEALKGARSDVVLQGPNSTMQLPATKTDRFLHSFKSVELLPEHYNYGDETPALRDLGMAPSIATALIRWGEQHSLVCRFEDKNGRSNNAYSWQPAFLVAAARKHIEIFGAEDMPARYLQFLERQAKRLVEHEQIPGTPERPSPRA